MILSGSCGIDTESLNRNAMSWSPFITRNKIKHINMPILAENYQSFFFPGQSAIKTLLIIQTAPQFINMFSQTTIALGLLLAGASAQQAANCEYQSFKCGSVLLAAPFSKQYLIPKERQTY
jgi:hypothetical protein